MTEPLSNSMAAECVMRDGKGHITCTTTIAVPDGLTHAEAVAYVRRRNQHEIASFVQYR